MNTAVAPASPRRPLIATRLFRLLVIMAACAALASAPDRVQGRWSTELLLFAVILAARCVPVAIAREKAIRFTAAFIFAASLLGTGFGAGLGALAACILQARLFQRGGRAYAAFIGAQYALAALASHTVFDRAIGSAEAVWRAQQPVGTVGAPFDRFAQGLPEVCLAALVFIGVNAGLVALGNLGTRYARSSHAVPVFGVQTLTYCLSFPFAVGMIYGFTTFGVAAIPCLAAILIACGHAVRMTIEVRVLSRQLLVTNALSRMCVTGLREDEPLELFLQLARQLVAFERASLWMSKEGAAALVPRAIYPADHSTTEPPEAGPETLIARIAGRKRPVLIRDTSRDPRCLDSSRTESVIYVPLLLHERVMGIAKFERSVARPFTRADMDRIAALAPQAAMGYENIQIRRKMIRYEDMATTDGLTGLWNHRRCREVLQIELSRAERYRRPLSILMMDLDSFKSFNDTYGHPEGDELLRGISRILRRSVRNVDYVGRYGGEEFIVVLPETARDEAYVLAERIRVAVAGHPFILGDGTIVHKTISIGVASFPWDAATDSGLVQHADTALYQAKHAGRNCVVMATVLPPS